MKNVQLLKKMPSQLIFITFVCSNTFDLNFCKVKVFNALLAYLLQAPPPHHCVLVQKVFPYQNPKQKGNEIKIGTFKSLSLLRIFPLSFHHQHVLVKMRVD